MEKRLLSAYVVLLLVYRGAYKIYVLATHGILSADAPRKIEDSPIDEVRESFLLTTFTAFYQSRSDVVKSYFFWII